MRTVERRVIYYATGEIRSRSWEGLSKHARRQLANGAGFTCDGWRKAIRKSASSFHTYVARYDYGSALHPRLGSPRAPRYLRREPAWVVTLLVKGSPHSCHLSLWMMQRRLPYAGVAFDGTEHTTGEFVVHETAHIIPAVCRPRCAKA